jgi:hypothetical protein
MAVPRQFQRVPGTVSSSGRVPGTEFRGQFTYLSADSENELSKLSPEFVDHEQAEVLTLEGQLANDPAVAIAFGPVDDDRLTPGEVEGMRSRALASAISSI